jgi:DnaJ domain
MNDCIEGVDYIFDRYAFLNLDKNAKDDEIKTSIRKMRAENHPDKLLRASDAIKQTAKAQIELIDQCERVLLNPDVKVLYDEKLSEFIQAEPHLVTQTGMPLMDLSRFKVNIDYLLNEDVLSLEELEAKAMQLSGYSPKKIEKIKLRVEKNPDDLEDRDELRQALTTKLIFISIMEDFYWQKAGVQGGVQKNENFRAQSTEDILQSFEEKISKISEHTKSAFENRNGAVLLGFTQPLLLGNSTVASPEPHLITEVIKKFELRAEDLKKLVKEKAQTIEELTKVSRIKELVQDTGTGLCDFILIMPQDDELPENWPGDSYEVMKLSFRLNKKDNSLVPFDFGHEFCTNEIVEGWPNQLYLVEPNKEISAPLLELMSLVNKIV